MIPCFCVETRHVCLCLLIFQLNLLDDNALLPDLALSCVFFLAENEMLPLILQA